MLGYGGDATQFWISVADHPASPDPASGLHFCFAAPSRRSVDAFHAAAPGAGGRDNGAPGLRPESYMLPITPPSVLDLDGYRIEVYCNRPA